MMKVKSTALAADRLFSTLFGLVFMGAGLLFMGLILRETFHDLEARTWAPTPCVITQSHVSAVEDGYALRVSYQYESGGRTYHSGQYSTKGALREDRVAKADALAAQYAAGTRLSCFVNPKDPSQAVLVQRSLLHGLLVFFPLIFVLIGAFVIASGWSRPPKNEQTPKMAKNPAFSITKTGGLGARIGLALFFSIFLGAGIAVGWFAVFPPVIQSLSSDDWVQTPCTVQSSRVRSHDSDDGTTYSIDICYAYTFQGRPYRSDRYGFMGGSSSGNKGKWEVVSQYPTGMETVCYVNPENPSQAVLKREMGLEHLWALFPLPFIAVGLGGVLWALFGKRSSTPAYYAKSKGMREMPHGQGGLHGVMTLKPQTSYTGKIVGGLFAAVFWNGIVSVFLHQAYKGWASGQAPIFLTLFMIPFVLVGLGIIISIPYYFLASFNPRPVLTLFANEITLGCNVKMQWQTQGKTDKIQRYTLTLVGEESAAYRRGTSTYTDREVFFRQVLLDETNPAFIRQGERRLRIPRETMHSFKSSNNAITWKIESHCDVPRWPDTRENFVIQVHPLPAGA